MTERSYRVVLAFLLSGAAATIIACANGPNDPAFLPPKATLVIESGVTVSTGISEGRVVLLSQPQAEGPEIPYVEFRLTVPDGSQVLQLTAPKADFVVVSENSRQEIVAKPCYLSVANGSRSFGAQHRVTVDQYNTLQSVIVKQIYQ